jgi:hypothetical protein
MVLRAAQRTLGVRDVEYRALEATFTCSGDNLPATSGVATRTVDALQREVIDALPSP